MADVQALWAEVLPEVKNSVTGVGVWSALNQAKPVVYENSTFVLGVPHEVSDLAGHLRMQQTRILIERMFGEKVEEQVTLRIIDGITLEDWELVKRKDAEAKRLQEQAIARQRAEIASRSSWDSVYDQISRKYASITNKSLPQNRAKFFSESVNLICESLKTMPINDDMAERNYARCIERVATYCELPSTYVALRIAEQSGA